MKIWKMAVVLLFFVFLFCFSDVTAIAAENLCLATLVFEPPESVVEQKQPEEQLTEKTIDELKHQVYTLEFENKVLKRQIEQKNEKIRNLKKTITIFTYFIVPILILLTLIDILVVISCMGSSKDAPEEPINPII